MRPGASAGREGPRARYPGIFARLTDREKEYVNKTYDVMVTWDWDEREATQVAERALKRGARSSWQIWMWPLLVVMNWFIIAGFVTGRHLVWLMSFALIVGVIAIVGLFIRRQRLISGWLRLEPDRDTQSEPPSALPEPAAVGVRRRFWYLPTWAVAVVAITGIWFFVYSAAEVQELSAWEPERAELLSVRPPATPSPDGCGKSKAGPRDFSWRSLDPPPGLPATFVASNLCELTYDEPGKVYKLVREVHDGKVTDVHVRPITSYGRAAGNGAMVAVVTWFGLAVVLGIGRAWKRRREPSGMSVSRS